MDLNVVRPRDVDAVDEPDAVRIVLHDHGACANAVTEESDAFHQRPIRDAGCGEDDALARRQILRAVDFLEIGDPHRAAALLVLRLADNETREDLAVQATHRRRGQDAFGSATGPHYRVHTGAGDGRRNPGRQIAVANQADPRT